MNLPAGLRRLLANWPELSHAAGHSLDSAELSSLSAGVAQDRLHELADVATSLEVPAEAALLAHQARFFRHLFDGGRWRQNPALLGRWSALLLRQALLAEAHPLEEQRLGELVGSIPRALKDAREGLSAPDPSALRRARDEAQRLGAQLDAMADLVPPAAMQGAYLALGQHRRWLAELTPGTPLPPLGVEALEALLRARGITRAVPELVTLAEQTLAHTATDADGPDVDPRALQADLVRDALRTELELVERLGALCELPVRGVRCEVVPPPPGLEAFEGAVLLPRPLRPDEGARLLFGGHGAHATHIAGRLLLAWREGPAGRALLAVLSAEPSRLHRALELCPLPALGAGLYAAERMDGYAHHVELLGSARMPPETGAGVEAQRSARGHAAAALAELLWHQGRLDDHAALQVLTERGGLTERAARSRLEHFRLQPTRALSSFVGQHALQQRGPTRAACEQLLRAGRAPLDAAPA